MASLISHLLFNAGGITIFTHSAPVCLLGSQLCHVVFQFVHSHVLYLSYSQHKHLYFNSGFAMAPLTCISTTPNYYLLMCEVSKAVSECLVHLSCLTCLSHWIC